MILHFLQYLLMLKALYTSYLLLPTSYFLPPTCSKLSFLARLFPDCA